MGLPTCRFWRKWSCERESVCRLSKPIAQAVRYTLTSNHRRRRSPLPCPVCYGVIPPTSRALRPRAAPTPCRHRPTAATSTCDCVTLDSRTFTVPWTSLDEWRKFTHFRFRGSVEIRCGWCHHEVDRQDGNWSGEWRGDASCYEAVGLDEEFSISNSFWR